MWSPDDDLALDEALDERPSGRRRGLVIGLGAALGVALLAVGGYLALPLVQGAPGGAEDPEPAPTTAGPSPTPSPTRQVVSAESRPGPDTDLPGLPASGDAPATRLLAPLDGHVTLAAYEIAETVYVWNPRARAFEATTFRSEPRVSPDGRWLAALEGETADVVLVDRTTGRRRTIARTDLPGPDEVSVYPSRPLWSPKSDRLLLHTSVVEGDTTKVAGVTVIEIGDLDPAPRARFVPVPGHVRFAWNADGSGFLANPASSSRRPAVRFLDADGRRVGELPNAGWLADDGLGSFSPSGGRLVTFCSQDDTTPMACLYDVASRKQIGSVRFTYRSSRIDDSLLGWYDEESLISDVSLPDGVGYGTAVVGLDGTITQPLLRKEGVAISAWFVGAVT